MFNPILIERKRKDPKPHFYCPSHKHQNSRGFIPYEDIMKCTTENCLCGQLNGW